MMLATDDKNSVLCEVGVDSRQQISYSPYGLSTGGDGKLGYNGELRDTPTGLYVLGNGYRLFSTLVMRFYSPDSWSPFFGGGLNAYMYCLGNPVGLLDETGHAPILGKLLGVLMFSSNAGQSAKNTRVGSRAGVLASPAGTTRIAVSSDDLLSGYTMTTTKEKVKFIGAARPSAASAGVAPSPSVPSVPSSSSSSRLGSSAAPSAPVTGAFAPGLDAPQTLTPQKPSKVPTAQPTAPKPLTKEQFNKMPSILRNDYLTRGGVDPTKRGFHRAPKKTALDVRNPDRDRFS